MAVVALVSDLVFESKITATANVLKLAVHAVRDSVAAAVAARDASGLLVDLNVPDGGALELVARMKAERPDLPIVAFLSHVQTDLARAARAAGADEVLPKSKFTEQLPEILRRMDAS